MKVILLQDVAKIGRRFEVVEVPHGYALNKLIPQKLAKEATEVNMKNVNARAEKIASENAAADETFKKAIAALDGKEITVSAEANENGHLFEAMKRERIVEALKAMNAIVTPEQIHIGTPIKSIGAHTVDLISGTERGEVTVQVVAK